MESNFNLKVFSDTIIVSISVKPQFYAYLLLILVTSLLILPFFLINLNNESFTFELFLELFIYLILIELFPLKYCFWNVFGKETLLFTKKSLSYKHVYGLISSNMKVVPHKNISVIFYNILIEKNKKFGKINFLEENDETGLIELIHKTSILISEENYECFILEFDKLFLLETFSLN
ncbi:hypothetical protein [Halpernia frigidisoli]|uniref:Uncharacterized protein n=1 Tax=Halpernia frigidisoli TaxID=1125876 RepID=A0A1I3DV97_9FLAO|nr:hypothetical protein [Halpernia frigidisoli]SFH90657.1 hypothetical protein SAMN05443292_0725 [Halpernia frigidisoli]